MEILDTVVHIAPLIILEGDYLERFAQNSGFVSQHFCHHFKYLLAADFMGGESVAYAELSFVPHTLLCVVLWTRFLTYVEFFSFNSNIEFKFF